MDVFSVYLTSLLFQDYSTISDIGSWKRNLLGLLEQISYRPD